MKTAEQELAEYKDWVAQLQIAVKYLADEMSAQRVTVRKQPEGCNCYKIAGMAMCEARNRFYAKEMK